MTLLWIFFLNDNSDTAHADLGPVMTVLIQVDIDRCDPRRGLHDQLFIQGCDASLGTLTPGLEIQSLSSINSPVVTSGLA